MGPSESISTGRDLTVQLDEPDLARSMFGRLYDVPRVDIQLDSAGEFAWDWNVAVRGAATLIRGHARMGAASVAGSPPFYVLALVEAGSIDIASSKAGVSIAPNMRGALVNANVDVSTFTKPGTRTLNLRIDPKALAAHLEALVGIPVTKLLEFDLSIDLSRGYGADLLRLTQLLFDAGVNPATPLGSPQVIAHLREALFSLLLSGHKHSASHYFHQPAPIANARAIKVAEEILDARASEPISIAEVADLVGLSLRSLERSYKKARGHTLRDFLQARRLELAHRQLAAARPGMTVTQVLYAAGFSHPGDFSRAYRERFGAAPSETLRRALGSDTAVAKSG